MPFIEIDDTELYYEYHGDGQPIVGLHGLEGDRTHLDWLSNSLSKTGYGILAFDQRGSGFSDKSTDPATYTTERLADDTDALMSALGIRSAAIMGLSMGGMVAQQVAIRHPERVDRLILGCTSAGGRWSICSNVPSPERIPQLLRQPVRDRALQSIDQEFSKSYRRSNINLKADIIREFSRRVVCERALVGRLKAFYYHDTFELIGNIRCPTLVISGDEDNVIPWENSQILARKIPNSKFILLNSCGHRFWDERPNECADIIKSFLAEL